MLEVRDGDLEQLGLLFRRHFASAHALCYRLTGSADVADDLAQDAFVRALRLRHSFRGESRFSTWFHRVTRNVCLDHLSRRARDARLAGEWSRAREDAAGDDAAEEDDADDARRAALAARALQRLSAEQREVIVLSRYHAMPYAEIALVLGCTPGAARVRLHRAVKALREVYRSLEAEGHDVQPRR